MTISFGEQSYHAAMRYDASGDYVSAITTADETAAVAGRLADRARTVANRKIKAARG
jgi:hypothetical protein